MQRTDRNPTDGLPYYCVVCGAGFVEYMSCELPDCTLEDEFPALERKRKKLKAVMPD